MIRLFKLLVLFLCSVFFLGNVVDLYGLYYDSSTYEKLYEFSYLSGHWQFQSVINYIIWRIVQMVLFLVLIGYIV